MWVELMSETKSSLMSFNENNLKQLKTVELSDFGGYLTKEEYDAILEDGCFVSSLKLQKTLIEISVSDLTPNERRNFMETQIRINGYSHQE